jgi:hypothetical protein
LMEVAEFPQRRAVGFPAAGKRVIGVLDEQNAVDPVAERGELGGLLGLSVHAVRSPCAARLELRRAGLDHTTRRATSHA